MKRKIVFPIKADIRFMLGLCFAVWISSVCFSCTPKSENASSGSTTPSATEQKATKPDPNKLVGRWLRPDGGYILEIRSASSDGKLDAGYFNPNPIHVARAEWVIKDNILYVMAELQDVNYPGSTYGLEYKAGTDHFVGTYYQAVEKSIFDVEFVREK